MTSWTLRIRWVEPWSNSPEMVRCALIPKVSEDGGERLDIGPYIGIPIDLGPLGLDDIECLKWELGEEVDDVDVKDGKKQSLSGVWKETASSVLTTFDPAPFCIIHHTFFV